MITLSNLSFFLGERVLYDQISLQISDKEKIGLIGPNGAGKTTLFKLLAGIYTPDEGEVSKSKNCTIGLLDQNFLSNEADQSILSTVLAAFEKEMLLQKEINELIQQLEVNYSENTVERLTNKQEAFEALGGYTLQTQAEEMLEGLGFSSDELQQPLSSFSGGWRMRVALARILIVDLS